MEKSAILKGIGAIGRKAKALTAEVQTLAVACGIHAVRHGDVTLADQLVDALGKGMRRASLRAWFERQTCMVLPKGKDKFAFDSERAKALRELSDDELTEKFNTIAWEEAKAEEPVVSVINVEEAFDKFMKRLEKQVKEATVTVQHKELLEELGATAARYHAQLVLNQRTPAEQQ